MMAKISMDVFRDRMAFATFGMTLSEARKASICVCCKAPVLATGFRDALSQREYEISGLCQLCQDNTFKEE